MDPQMETIWKIGHLEHQEMMRKAAQQRRAATAMTHAASPWDCARTVQQATFSRLRDLLSHEHRAQRIRRSSLLTSG
jgi:hypothetical protein